MNREGRIIDEYVNGGKGAYTIAKELGCSPSVIYRTLERNNICRRNNREKSLRYLCKENFFEKISSEARAYWLGFILADGCIIEPNILRIALHQKDHYHLVKFKESIYATHPVHRYDGASCPYSRISIVSNKMVADLAQWGVVPRKSLILKPPVLDQKMIIPFLRGYFDGDGCITHSGSQCKVKITGTEPALDVYASMLREYGIRNGSNLYPTKTVFSLELSGNRICQKFLDLLYSDATIYLDRKYELYQELLNTNSRA